MANDRPQQKSTGMSNESVTGTGNDDGNYQQVDESQETRRRNSWFKAESFHMGGVAPSGNATPEFRNGHWEGGPSPSDTPRRKVFHTGGATSSGNRTPGDWNRLGNWGSSSSNMLRQPPGMTSTPGSSHRSVEEKYARSSKKKEKQRLVAEQIEKGTGMALVGSDTYQKSERREDARSFLELLRNRWVGNGKDPESSFSTEAVECARLGSTFLTLAERGEHYASGKCLRSQMMRKRRELDDPMFQGHLSEYQDLYQIYQEEWHRRHENHGLENGE